MTGTDELIQRCRCGDQEAARELFDAYVDRLLPLARRRISHSLASRVDAEDVLQSVFLAFFARIKDDRFQIADEDGLFRLLASMTTHKVLKQVHRHKASKRDPAHELAQGEPANDQLLHLLAAGPTPDVAVAFLDQLEHFLSQFPQIDRRVLELRLQGYSTDEIALQLNTYDRKVRRVLERIRDVAEDEGWPGK